VGGRGGEERENIIFIQCIYFFPMDNVI